MPQLDIKNYMSIHELKMSQVTGPKGFAISGVIRDLDD
jgi:hypothetical protein